MSKTVEIKGYTITVSLLSFDLWTYIVTHGEEFFQTGQVEADDEDSAITAALEDVEVG